MGLLMKNQLARRSVSRRKLGSREIGLQRKTRYQGGGLAGENKGAWSWFYKRKLERKEMSYEDKIWKQGVV